MQIYRFTSIGRPLDPRYPTNLAIAVLTGLVLAIGTALSLLQGQAFLDSFQRGLVLGGAVFLAWALAREVDPEHPWAAFVASGLALVGSTALPRPDFAALLWALVASRVVNRTVGLPAGTMDSLAVLGLGAWISFRSAWLYGLLTALAFGLDAWLPKAHRRQAFFAAAALAVAVGAAIFGGGGLPGTTTSLPFLASVLAGCLVVLPLILWTRELETRCDVTDERLEPARIRAAQILGLLTMAGVALWQGMAGIGALFPLWAALLGPSVYGVAHRLVRTRGGSAHGP